MSDFFHYRSIEPLDTVMPRGPLLHRLLAFLAVCGFCLSIVAYLVSFTGKFVDRVLLCEFVLGVAGAMLLAVSNHDSHRGSGATIRIWKKPNLGRSKWSVNFARLLVVVAMAQFAFPFVQYGGGVPSIIEYRDIKDVAEHGTDRQYVVSQRGKVSKVLSVEEYLAFQSQQIRIFAAVDLALYFVPTLVGPSYLVFWSCSARPMRSPSCPRM